MPARTQESDHRALARKYRTLAAIRAAGGAAREQLRALAAEFPGALRELDNLPLEELEERAAALEAGADEPWMGWLAAYHAWSRAALWLKTHPGDLAGASDRAGRAVDAAFASAVARPPGRRLVRAVLERVAADSGVPKSVIEARLFPPHPSRR